MGTDSFSSVERLASHLNLDLDRTTKSRLHNFHGWLADEAKAAGGIGPGEIDRLWDRHIADSLAFLPAASGVARCLDIGSGVGLPGIALAIVLPDTEFHLLDRSGRRCDLMRRAVALLGLQNCGVLHQDIAQCYETYAGIVSRAAIPPEKVMIHVKRLLERGGVAILGLSRSTREPDSPQTPSGLNTAIVTIPAEVLDSGAKLLRIEAT